MIEPYYKDNHATIYHGDCLDILPEIGTVDLVLADPPYGTTACEWDSVIPLEPMWEQLKRIIKPNGAIVLFGSEPFSSALRISNIKNYKYDWIWVKDKATNHLNARKMPLKKTENISVFYGKQCRYTPQLHDKHPEDIRPPTTFRPNISNYGTMNKVSTRTIPIEKGYPCEVLFYKGCSGGGVVSFHPTQKPVTLMQYLIKTYTNEGDTVLDFTMGSGTTLRAAKNLGRTAIGIEKKEKYCQTAVDRLRQEVLNFGGD